MGEGKERIAIVILILQNITVLQELVRTIFLKIMEIILFYGWAAILHSSRDKNLWVWDSYVCFSFLTYQDKQNVAVTQYIITSSWLETINVINEFKINIIFFGGYPNRNVSGKGELNIYLLASSRKEVMQAKGFSNPSDQLAVLLSSYHSIQSFQIFLCIFLHLKRFCPWGVRLTLCSEDKFLVGTLDMWEPLDNVIYILEKTEKF